MMPKLGWERSLRSITDDEGKREKDRNRDRRKTERTDLRRISARKKRQSHGGSWESVSIKKDKKRDRKKEKWTKKGKKGRMKKKKRDKEKRVKE